MEKTLSKRKRVSTRTKIFIAVLAAVALVCTGALAVNSHTKAYATPYVGEVQNGTGVAGTSDTHNDQTQFFGTQLYDTDLAGTYDDFWCATGAGDAPCDGHHGSFTATCTSIDEAGCTATYDVYFTPDDASDGYQCMDATITIHADFGGYIHLAKHSANPDLTNNNGCYSLGGAVYNVYTDPGCTNAIGSIATDNSGNATTCKLSSGSYYLKEVQASSGFTLDKQVHRSDVSNGNTSGVDSTEQPTSDPASFWAGKIDLNTTNQYAQAGATFAGAQYTVKYYDGYYDESSLPSSSTRTWIVQTNDKGRALLLDQYKISGDDFYTYDGRTTIPLGTITVQETKAPNGYLLSKHGLYVKQIHQIGDATEVDSYDAPMDPEPVMHGDYRLVKEVCLNNAEQGQDATRVLVQGAQFQIINDNDGQVMSPVDQSMIDKGNAVCTLTTDENGLASTKNSSANGWSTPDSWTGALPFGTYTVHEVLPDSVVAQYKVQYGVTVLPVSDWKITISKDGQYLSPTLVTDKIPQTPLEIQKQDAETGKTVPLACSFQIYDSNNNLVTYTDETATTEAAKTVDTFTTDNSGKVILPMKLYEGTYTVHELTAPDGYALNSDPLSFTVCNYDSWDNPIVVTCKDTPIKANLTITKTDKDTAKAVKGAEYSVSAATDITTPDGTVHFKQGDQIASGTTDDNGIINITNLYFGKYNIQETKAPDGYALDSEVHTVEAVSQGQNVPVIAVASNVTDEETSLVISKTNSDTKDAVPGATFDVYTDGALTYDGPTAVSSLSSALGKSTGVKSVTINNQEAVIDQLNSASANSTVNIQTTIIDNNTSAKTSAVPDSSVTTGSSNVQTFTAQMNDGYSITIVDSDNNVITQIPAKQTNAKGTYYNSVTTGSDGTVTIKLLAHGNYNVCETGVPAGYEYSTNPTVNTFIVDENGLINNSSSYTLTVENAPLSIGTTALDKKTGTHDGTREKDTTIVDTIEYKGLVPGKEYEMDPYLVDSDTGNPIEINGSQVTNSLKFIPTTTDGSVQIEIPFDSTATTNASFTVFEDMKLNGSIVAVHHDVKDTKQTVTYSPILHTTALDSTSDSHNGIAGTTVTINDQVDYQGLHKGEQYTLKATLMDKSTGKACQVNGSDVVVSQSFTPDDTTGSVIVPISYDMSAIDSQTCVVFEDLYFNDKLIAKHEDLNNTDQTVTYAPQIGTTAVDRDTNDHDGTPASNNEVIDTVQYSGLVKGAQYTVNGTLMDKSTGNPLDINGNNVTGSTTFTAPDSNGSVDVALDFDGSSVDADTVAFEDVTNNNGKTIAFHRDINDSGQSVSYHGSPFDQTGNFFMKYGWAVLLIASVGIYGGFRLIRYLRDK